MLNYKTLDTFKFESQPSLNRLLVSELLRCPFFEQRESVILFGNPGTGKTHFATALAIEACHRGYQVRFFRVTELVTQLMEGRDERQLQRFTSALRIRDQNGSNGITIAVQRRHLVSSASNRSRH